MKTITNKRMNTKQIIDTLYNERYEYLLECSFNVLKLIGRTELAAELVTQSYLYIDKNIDKIKTKIDEGKLESIVVRYMTMQIYWSNTTFKKEYIYTDEKINGNIAVEDLGLLSDEIPEEELLQQEKEIQDELSHVYKYINEQDLATQILFKNIFKEDINTSGKLSRHTGINRTSCYYLIKELKANIRNNYKK